MAHSPGVNWICDRCRKPISLPSGEVPAGWKFVDARPMGTGRLDDKFDREWEICPACYNQVERLLMNVDIPE